MEKDLIIGNASYYNYNDLKPWINSIRMSGFTGDVVLVGSNMEKTTIDKLSKEGIIVQVYGKKDENGNVKGDATDTPHVDRFFYMWEYLKDKLNNYRYVITTDTRDVIFQVNPSEWLEQNLIFHDAVCATEGLLYKDEPWGNDNLMNAFGPYFYNRYKDNVIYNVGTIAGDAKYMLGLFFLLFQMSINRPIRIVDQACFNVIIDTPPHSELVARTTTEDSWAINLGTTEKSVLAGSGELGVQYASKMEEYYKMFLGKQPVIDGDMVKNVHGEPYVIVHQYDRIPDLNEKILAKYGV